MTIYTLICLAQYNVHFLWDIACKAGNYGKNCSFHCSSNCNWTCLHKDELCEDCKEGWKNNCPKGNFKLPVI